MNMNSAASKEPPVRDREGRASHNWAKTAVRALDSGAARNLSGVREVACSEGRSVNWGGVRPKKPSFMRVRVPPAQIARSAPKLYLTFEGGDSSGASSGVKVFRDLQRRNSAHVKEMLAAVLRALPSAEHVVLHGQGHTAHVRAPDQVARVIEAHADTVLRQR
jgi:hypothetical protein